MNALNASKPWIIILDGLDKSGKTTIRDILLKKLNRSHDVIDRWLLSDVSYNMLYNRNSEDWYDPIIDNLKQYDRHLLVYVKADLSDESKLPELDMNDDIEKDYLNRRKEHERYFVNGMEYLINKGLNVCVVNNDYVRSLEDIANEIIEIANDREDILNHKTQLTKEI